MTSLHYLLSTLTGRPTCIKDRTTRLGFGARIINIARDPSRIQIGANTTVDGELLTFAHGGRIRVGDWCYIGPGTRIWSGADISIGNRVLIAHNVNIFDNLTHPLDARARHRQTRAIFTAGHPSDIDLDDKPVVVEDDAWIGASASVMRDVRIGRGAIVATAAVVTKSVAPFTVVAGNPATVIRTLEPVEVSPAGE